MCVRKRNSSAKKTKINKKIQIHQFENKTFFSKNDWSQRKQRRGATKQKAECPF